MSQSSVSTAPSRALLAGVAATSAALLHAAATLLALAIFIAMNWGFAATLLSGAAVYLLAAGILAARPAA
jgi:hypothetical protein